MSDWLESGIRAFNRGRYFQAHERWEDWWRESSGATRGFAQGLVQVAVGLHHLERGNRRGGQNVLRRGLGKLEQAPAVFHGIDNARLINDIQAYLDGGATQNAPRVRLLPPPDRS